MNYTGRPSISGCRPVLSLYPTHRFCQYLLLIFITFTNSFLFNRAFSTNSRRPLRRAAGVTAPGLNLSVTADAVPPPLPRGGFGSPRRVNGFARGSPTRGAVERSETERLYEGEPDRHANGSPSGGAGEEQGDETERARLLTANPRHSDSIALIKSLPITAPAALSCRACPLRHCFAMPPLPRGEALAGRIVSCIFLAKRVV